MIKVSSSLSAAVVYGVIGATLANLAAIYAFHISDPDTMEEIETGLLSDTLRAEAQKQATANIESQAKELGAILAARATGQLKYNLRLPMGTEEAAQANSFIDATVSDIAPAEKTTSKNGGGNIISNWIRHTARKMQRVAQPAPVVQVYEAETSAPKIVPTEAKQTEAGEPLTYHPVGMQPAATEQPEAADGEGVFTKGMDGER